MYLFTFFAKSKSSLAKFDISCEEIYTCGQNLCWRFICATKRHLQISDARFAILKAGCDRCVTKSLSAHCAFAARAH